MLAKAGVSLICFDKSGLVSHIAGNHVPLTLVHA